MRSAIAMTILVLAAALCARAEYQAYDYRCVIRRIEAAPAADGAARGARVVTDVLRGILVSVACYPCGADSGKGYQCWLFLVSRRAGGDVVWRVPCAIDQGLHGPACMPSRLSEMAWLDPTRADREIMRRASRGWIHLEFRTESAKKASGDGLWGPLAVKGMLVHDGHGLGATKINAATDDPAAVFNPYLRTASGTVTGWSLVGGDYGFDPSSRRMEEAAPIAGTFRVKYNAAVTEEIRGTSDWDEIARRVLLHFRYATLLEEEYDQSMMWQEYPESKTTGQAD